MVEFKASTYSSGCVASAETTGAGHVACWKEGDGSVPMIHAVREHFGLLLELYTESLF